MAQRVKRLPTMWETRVQSLGREDPLEKEMATHSSILAWRIPWMGLQSTRSQSQTRLSDFTSLFLLTGFPGGSAGKESTCTAADLGSIPGSGRSPGEGKGYPLQYSGPENSWTVSSTGSQRVGHSSATFTFLTNISFEHLLCFSA